MHTDTHTHTHTPCFTTYDTPGDGGRGTLSNVILWSKTRCFSTFLASRLSKSMRFSTFLASRWSKTTCFFTVLAQFWLQGFPKARVFPRFWLQGCPKTPWFAVVAGGTWMNLQNHFVPDRHLGWHLGPYLPDRVLAILTRPEATRQVEEELRTTTWVVGNRLPNGTELPFPWNFHEGVSLKFLMEDSDDEVISISSG